MEVLRDYDLIAVPVFVDTHRRDAVQARTEMAHAASLLVATGSLSRGFRLPQASLQIFAETDVFEEERRPSDRRRSAAGAFLSDFRDLKVGNFVVHVDHGIGVFVGLRQIPVDAYGGPTQEFLELRYAGEDKLFVPVERLDLLQKYTGASQAAARSPGRHHVGAREDPRQEGDARHGGGAAQALRPAPRASRARLPGRHPLAGGVRGGVRVRPHHRPAGGGGRHQVRHAVQLADGPAAVRRRRLRQDRGGHAGRLQVGDGRQAGGLPRADHHPRLPAPEDAARAVCGLPGSHRHGEPLPLEGRDQADAGRPCRRQGGHHRRHAPPALQGRRLPRPRPARRGRGAALRRGAQGAHQADAQQGGRPDDDRDADPEDAEHVAGGHPRHVRHRDAAQGPPGHSDQRRALRPAGDRQGHPQRAGAQRPDLLRAQPRAVDLRDRRPHPAPGARGEDRRRPRPDGGGRAGARDGGLHGAQVRHPPRHDHRRKRPRHPERQHDHHQPRGPLRAVAALPAARPRRADRIGRPTPTC